MLMTINEEVNFEQTPLSHDAMEREAPFNSQNQRCICAAFVIRVSLPRDLWGGTKSPWPLIGCLPAFFYQAWCSERLHSKDVLRKNLRSHKLTVAVAPPSAEPEEPVNDLHNHRAPMQQRNWFHKLVKDISLFFGKTDIYFIRITLSNAFYHLRVYGEHFSKMTRLSVLTWLKQLTSSKLKCVFPNLSRT